MGMIARLGDPTSHGGKVITGSTDKLTDGLPTARIGDLVSCPIHNTNKIINVSSTVITDGVPTGEVSARSECGSVVISGSQDVFGG